MVADPECQQLGVGVHSEQLGDPKKEKEETWIHFLPIVTLPFWES